MVSIAMLWSDLFPKEIISFFYHYTPFFVIGTWFVFLIAWRVHRSFAFSKLMLIFFGLFIAIYSIDMINDGIRYVEMLFPNNSFLWDCEIIDYDTKIDPQSYFLLDGSYYNVIEYECGNRLTDSIYYRLAASPLTCIGCIVYDLLFIISLLRKHFGKAAEGGVQ